MIISGIYVAIVNNFYVEMLGYRRKDLTILKLLEHYDLSDFDILPGDGKQADHESDNFLKVMDVDNTENDSDAGKKKIDAT